MAPTPPSFGSRGYWNKRFTDNTQPFEWLEAPNALDPYIVDASNKFKDPNLQLLHIGCGTSLLSYHLRAHVKNPRQIHNLDYSDVAIQLGKRREAEIFRTEVVASDESIKTSNYSSDGSGSESSQAAIETIKEEQPAGNSGPSLMRWTSADLLDHNSLLRSCKPSTYSVVVDKSTSDSIACSDDLYLPLPYHVVASSTHLSGPAITKSSEPLHPLHIMAVHLALVTKPGGRWISLSYSTDRYPFLKLSAPCEGNRPAFTSHASDHPAGCEEIPDDELSLDENLDEIPKEIADNGFPNPSTLWTLVGKFEIEPQTMPETLNGNGTIHRPKVMHWIYVLERTNVPLFVRP